jgi:hypothetical protein
MEQWELQQRFKTFKEAWPSEFFFEKITISISFFGRRGGPTGLNCIKVPRIYDFSFAYPLPSIEVFES